MRVAIDSWTLTNRFRHFGTYVYTRHLISEFKQLAAQDPALEFCLFASDDDSNDANSVEPSTRFGLSRTSLWKHQRLWRMGGVAYAAARAKADLLFSPTPNVFPIGPVPVISTIHDAIPSMMPAKWSKVWALLRFMTASSAKRSLAIITDSEWSKKDLVQLYGLPESKVSVVYLGYDKNVYRAGVGSQAESSSLRRKLGIEKPYIFHHGKIQPRKNLPRLIAAYRLLMSRNHNLDLDLVLVGGLGWDYDEVVRGAGERPGQGRVILPGALSDAEIAVLIRSATLVVIPTLYEGFCLPMVEAMACGAPTIASRASCLPEVSGNLLRYFDPFSIEDIASCMEQVLEDDDLREELGRKGKERAETFDWTQCARETLNVFRREMQNGRD
jgi:glycosyltransferase involved in cell wall biosynthesis